MLSVLLPFSRVNARVMAQRPISTWWPLGSRVGSRWSHKPGFMSQWTTSLFPNKADPFIGQPGDWDEEQNLGHLYRSVYP